MENHEFDNALRDFVNSSEIPYDAAAWQSMSQRLHAHEGNKSVPPAVRIIPFRKWAAAGIAACLLVMAGWYLKELQPNVHMDATLSRKGDVLHQKQQPTSDKLYDTINETLEEPTASVSKTEKAARVPGRASAIRTALPPESSPGVQAVIPAGAYPIDTQALAAGNPAVSDVTVTNSSSPQKKTYIPYGLLPESELPGGDERVPVSRKMAYGISGGYNIGSGQNNFTVGVNVRRTVSRHLHFETGLALVGGTNKSYEQQTQMMLVPTPNPGTGIGVSSIDTQFVTVFEQVNNNLLYLQAAPALSYELFKGFSAGGGVDVQRLLSSADKSVSINSVGREVRSQPQWDFGVTARMDYQLAKKLRSGVAYRESIGGITKGTSGAAKRSYLLVQLSYTLF